MVIKIYTFENPTLYTCKPFYGILHVGQLTPSCRPTNPVAFSYITVSLWRHIRHQRSIVQYGGCKRKATWLLHGDSFMATPTLKSNTGDRNVCKKNNLSWLFGSLFDVLLAKPRDAKQWLSDGYFYPHLTLMKDSYNLPYNSRNYRCFIRFFLAETWPERLKFSSDIKLRTMNAKNCNGI